ncbi:Acetyl esterase/lipase [Allopseudospirillum japonicum]|uniref:Acetyl esterase/lipase n=2 Tax=Allopseudospirillum japonicum TaxID=64971 RepID=A0A1H6RZI2_9GAMM|nr:Acetyl esterase/lipase [Allopseudospirillum japonicum]
MLLIFHLMFTMPINFWQKSTQLLSRQCLTSQCLLLKEHLKQQALLNNTRLPHDIQRQSLCIAGREAEFIHVEGQQSQRYILYLHGGGYALGSIDTHRELVCHLARFADARILAIDYRLAPESPYPAALEDALAAYHWLLEQGTAHSSIALAGDSAGGGLALALLQRLKQDGLPLPAAAVFMSPWVDLTCSSLSLDLNAATDLILNKQQMRAFAELYARDIDLEDAGVSPLFGDLENLPPILVQVSQQELLRDDAVRLVKKIAEKGGQATLDDWAYLPHVWQLMYNYLPQAGVALRRAGRFIQKHVH